MIPSRAFTWTFFVLGVSEMVEAFVRQESFYVVISILSLGVWVNLLWERAHGD